MKEKYSLSVGSAIFVLIFFFFAQPAFCQLNDFGLSVTKTDETCSGNGSLTFQVSNPTAGANFTYSVYLLPNTLNPIGVTSLGSITGLVAGNYRVIAVQTLNQLSNTQQQDVTISSLINPLVFQLSGNPQDCINGSITVNVTQGNPATYEIISGPVIKPPQTSNILENLPVGQYVVRVNDSCGDGIVQTYTLTGASSLSITPWTQTCQAISCTSVSGQITISTAPEGLIYYPLQVFVTLIPPQGGSPQTFSQTLTSGSINPPRANVFIDLPILSGQTYSYNIRVVDACGNQFTYSGTNLIRTDSIEFTGYAETENTPSFLKIDTCNMVMPVSVEFTDAPPGFNPGLFNSGHPGPFFAEPLFYSSTPDHILPLGHYEVSVTDACGIVHTGECNLGDCKPFISATPVCSTFGLTKLTIINTATIVEAPPSFQFPLPYVANVVNNQFTIQLPLGTYTFEGIDQCGQPYTITRTIDLATYNITGDNQGGCENNTGSLEIVYANIGLELAITGVRILTAPSGFPHALPYDASEFILPTAEIQVLITGLISGDYTLEVIDVCGNVYPLAGTVPQYISSAPPTAAFLKGCTVGLGSIFIDTPNRKFVEVMITEAPSSFVFPLPYDVSFNLNSQGKFFMNNLPEGTYVFRTRDVCGISNQTQFVIPGYSVLQSDVTILERCGSFDLVLNHVMSQPYQQLFWLQKWNPVSGQWGHPYTGAIYPDGTTPNATNSYLVYNFSTNLNIALYGNFRVVKTNQIYSNASAAYANCPIVVIKEFEFTGELKVINASGVLCTDGTYNTLITVAGVAPFEYRITSKDGIPFSLNNGNSNYFSNLSPGIYNFQIEDQCGNIVNRLYDIETLLEPSVSQANLCNGQNGKLLVVSSPFFNYQWWKADAPSVILSTSETLNFTPFNSAIHSGQYFVRIYANSNVSCLDRTLSYTIPTVSNPRAGNDATVSVCGNLNAVNLFTLLSGDFETTGSWEEISNSGSLTGAVWSPLNIAFGTYQFKYLVNGFCDDTDDAMITVLLKPLPEVPEILSGNLLCLGQPYQFEVGPIFNASFDWNGPNGFNSQEQNPMISNPSANSAGIYTLDVTVGGCVSSNSTELTVAAPPDFSFVQGCAAGFYSVNIVPIENSFDQTQANYQWTGPGNFSSTENPVDLTGYPAGSYIVKVTDAEGCSQTKSVNVNSTFCGEVQLGISPNDDGLNDELDLTGLGRDIQFKIFNRYGTMVYEQNNYTNQWHGQDYHNRQLPDATYFYYIKLKSGEEKTGWVYVSR